VTGCLLQPNTTYIIILVSTYGTDANYVAWGYHYDGTYANGTWKKSLDGGLTFPIAYGIDAGFQVWGIRR